MIIAFGLIESFRAALCEMNIINLSSPVNPLWLHADHLISRNNFCLCLHAFFHFPLYLCQAIRYEEAFQCRKQQMSQKLLFYTLEDLKKKHKEC